jgi:hypothetical protein
MQVLSKLLEPNDKSQKVVSPFPLDNRSQARLQSIIRILKKAIKSVGLKNPLEIPSQLAHTKKKYSTMGTSKRSCTLPRRHAYHTKSNRMQVVKTPGGKLVMHVVNKRSSGPKCGDTGVQLHGVSGNFY